MAVARSLIPVSRWRIVVVPPVVAAGALVAAGGLPHVALLAVLGVLGALVGVTLMVVAVNRPSVMLYGALLGTALFEADAQSLFPAGRLFFRRPPSPLDLLLVLATFGLGAQVAMRKRPLVIPRALVIPLIILGTACVAGAATGYFAGAPKKLILYDCRGVAYLLLVPILVSNLVRPELLIRLLGTTLVLAYVKSAEGLAGFITHTGRKVGHTTLTFYGPTANFMLMLVILGISAAAVRRLRVPPWMNIAAVLGLATLVLSFRRNFWLALPIGLMIVLLGGSRLRHRIVYLVVVAVVGVFAYTSLQSHQTLQLNGAVGKRLASLSPSKVETNAYDRYRLDEARNVFAELKSHPLLGIGAGVPWNDTRGLPVELDGGRFYTHVDAFWFWLKFGLAGLIGWAMVFASGVWICWNIVRRSADARFQAAALGIGAGLLALCFAETTGSFTGADPRFSVFLGAVLGWAALVEARTPRSRDVL